MNLQIIDVLIISPAVRLETDVSSSIKKYIIHHRTRHELASVLYGSSGIATRRSVLVDDLNSKSILGFVNGRPVMGSVVYICFEKGCVYVLVQDCFVDFVVLKG